MAEWDHTEPDIERIREEVEKRRPPVRFDVIYNCPFSGFLDEGRTRVGCLLHPLRLGQDLRDHCRYGHRTCGEARCAAYSYISEAEARAVMAAALDWYVYGLAITDADLVKDFFELCEMKLYMPVDPERVVHYPELRRTFGEYLSLKEDWFLARDPGRFGKYYFVGKNYNVYFIEYHQLGLMAPRYNDIILALGSVIETRTELEQALEIIDRKVDAFLEVYASTASPRSACSARG
jgi:hypothetical protein